MIKTDVGIELLVTDSDVLAIKAKAMHQGIITGEPKPRQPKTRHECDSLLNALTPAAKTAAHDATREYIREWIAEIKANLPAHTRAQRPQTNGQASEPRTAEALATATADNNSTVGAQQPEIDPLDIMDLGCFYEDLSSMENGTIRTEPVDMAEPPGTIQSADMAGSQNIAESAAMADTTDMVAPTGMGDTTNMVQQAPSGMVECWHGHTEGSEASYGSRAGSIKDGLSYMAPSVPTVPQGTLPHMDTHTSNATWLRIEYVNANGLCSSKLAAALGHLSHNMILFVAETWHIQDAKMRTCTGVMAISPELYRSPVSRGKGGLALFAHEGVASRLQIVSTGEFHLSARIDGTSISGIYLPPSMDCSDHAQGHSG